MKQAQRAARSQAGSKREAGYMNYPYSHQHFCYRNAITFASPTLQVITSRTSPAHKARFEQNLFLLGMDRH